MTSEGGALEHVEETSKLYRETTVPVEIKQPTAGGYLRVSKHSKIRQIELLVTTVHFAQKFIALLVFDMGLGEKVELHNYIIWRLNKYVCTYI